ncbi:unnamed protein product [Peniophora sp. CBMAI 1063]|nr:unnamed protein product [Peniophora sp. CBMAI 1063]
MWHALAVKLATGMHANIRSEQAWRPATPLLNPNSGVVSLALSTMIWPWMPTLCVCLVLLLIYLTIALRVRSACAQLAAYLISVSPPTLRYLNFLDVDSLSARSVSRTASAPGAVNSSRLIRVLEDRHQSEVSHLQRALTNLSELLDESRERETRQKRRVQRKVGQERKLTTVLGEQLTVAHASTAQARHRVLEMNQLCTRVQSANARLKAENDELRQVGGEVLDDNERLLADLDLTRREAERYRGEISRLQTALDEQEASARSTVTSLRDQLDRVKGSFALLEEIVDDARAELFECRNELDHLKSRLAHLPEACDDDVSDLELERTLFDADVSSETGVSSSASDESHTKAAKHGPISSPAHTHGSITLNGSTKSPDKFKLRLALEDLRSILPSTLTVRVVATPPTSSSSLAALDLAYRRAADQLSYEDLLTLDFPSFSTVSSFDSDTCDITPSFPTVSLPKSFADDLLPLSSLASEESQPSSSTSAPSLTLFADSDKLALDPFDANPMLAIPTFRLTHSAPPSPRRLTRYAQDLEDLCLHRSTSMPRAVDELALVPLPRVQEKLMDVAMPHAPKLTSSKLIYTHARASTAPLASCSSSSSTTSLPLFASIPATPPPEDPFALDPMLAVPIFRLASSAPPTPKRLSRSDRHLERMTMRASTSLPEPLDEILPEYEVHVPTRRNGNVTQERILDEKVPWEDYATSESLDEFDTVGIPPLTLVTRATASI